MLEFFKIGKSTYFYNINSYQNEDKDIDLKKQIEDIFKKHKERYGYRRVALALRNEGILVNHKKVKRLMKLLNLFGRKPKAKYKSYQGEVGKTANNHLLVKEINPETNTTTYIRNFKTEGLNQVWGTDVSEFHIAAGKLYVSPILDIHNREVVACAISKSPDYRQTKAMLEEAFSKYESLKGLILHSDQGWQYQMYHYSEELKRKGIIQSMSRKGNCLDNSIVENFFGIMKNEMFYGYQYTFKTLEQLEQAILKYIDYYNNERITTKLKGLSPSQYRLQSSN
jgi:transposase InsO family protein